MEVVSIFHLIRTMLEDSHLQMNLFRDRKNAILTVRLDIKNPLDADLIGTINRKQIEKTNFYVSKFRGSTK